MTETNQTASTPFNIKIPGYQIKRLLGKGGMASVYLAVQESFGRDVAIKVLSPDMAQDKEFSQRFLREAQIVSRLQHPNIVTVYDVGIHDGYHYLSMEYIPGRELREAKYDLPKREVIRIIREVARALDYAHKQGYIHRDVKPENIMLHDNG
ncbi:MAG: serine/threonine-protein kinase, partial [Thioalkalispiraceae bacterium]